ncbi:MAG: protein tyrosine/serine phosphatase [Caulobacteraceae bacterium]|nr:protein tyrosine/serine phosphatase [Caulobacteraceae bacterium]
MSAIELNGVINFRDFGGGVGAGGRRIRTSRLFRSGHHATATDADLERLAALGFVLFVDLRRPPERARDPARRPAAALARVLEHQGPTEQLVAPHLAFLAEPGATPRRVSEQMIVGYRGYPFDPHYVAVYRDYFALLAELDGPVLINCHAGKDRTGFLCALTLHVLGAPREDISADYLATNRHNRADGRLAELAVQFEQTHGHAPSEALLRAMLSVDPAWLDAAFAAIADRHGDIDTYLRDVIGVTAARRQAIRERLLV